MRRRLPRYADLVPLLRFKPLVLDPTRRRLERALTIDDLRRIARRRTPRAAFDYTDGAAEQEISLQRARQAFADIGIAHLDELEPRHVKQLPPSGPAR